MEAIPDAPYKVQVSLNSKYRSLILRGRMIHEQIQKSEFSERRQAGYTNLDLWLEGKVYPLDPITKKRPRFNDIKSLLEFVGDGKDGLLGYACNLQSAHSFSDYDVIQRQRSQLEIQSLSEGLEASMRDYNSMCLEFQSERRQFLAIHHKFLALQDEYSGLKNASVTSDILIASQRQEIELLTKEVKERSQSEINLEAEIDSLQSQHATETASLVQIHRSKLEEVHEEFFGTKKELLKLQRKWRQLKLTPYGYRKQVRSRKDMHCLSQTGGHAKAQRRLARAIISPATVKQIQADNAANNRKQRLHGPLQTQIKSGKVLAHILSRKEVSSILENPSFESVGMTVTNENLHKIGEEMVAQDVLATCDRSNITQSGWNAIFQTFSKCAKTACHGIRITCLPKPYHVTLLRRELNSKFKNFVGEYYSINNSIEIPADLRSKNKNPTCLKLNDNNSLFLDIETVQRTMVSLYRITPVEIGDDPLIFVLKIDEAEIVHDKKFERVSITMMNRALNRDITPNSLQYFSVQSEREIWPVGCFQVEKESHAVLSWVFKQTKFPDIIAAQEAGQLLEVPGVGDFRIQWHISADMKSIKCLYGLSHGAQAKMSCMYCCQESTKSVIGTAKQAEAAFAKKSNSWKGGLFSTNVVAKPITEGPCLSRWKPIFAIPMDRVHMCTLHAFNRIVEKIIHLHFQFIWTMKDKELQRKAINEMQIVVSTTGAHGGNVKIFKDEKLSGKKNDIPCKPSFNGAHAAKLFKLPSLSGGPERLYSDVVSAENNFLDDGVNKRKKLDVWIRLEALRPYFTQLKLDDIEQAAFKELVQAWGSAYIEAFGETHVTHYIHAFVRHAVWFVEKYGSLAIWSCQGMEYSHYAAKSAYQRHTQHSGGRSKKSPLIQTYQHWYRIIQHRFRDEKKAAQEEEFRTSADGLATEALITKRREASVASSAEAHARLWREKCERIGSKYVPRTHAVPASTSVIDDEHVNVGQGIDSGTSTVI